MFARLIIISTTVISSAHGMMPSQATPWPSKRLQQHMAELEQLYAEAGVDEILKVEAARREAALAGIAEKTGALENNAEAGVDEIPELLPVKAKWSLKSLFCCGGKKDKKECDEAEVGRQFAREQGWTSFVQGKAKRGMVRAYIGLKSVLEVAETGVEKKQAQLIDKIDTYFTKHDPIEYTPSELRPANELRRAAHHLWKRGNCVIA